MLNLFKLIDLGWTTGKRSVSWYRSGANYITIPFTGVKDVYRISINQLDSLSYTQFSAFKISYSMDGISFVEFSEARQLILKG